jgi:hypothetical protein
VAGNSVVHFGRAALGCVHGSQCHQAPDPDSALWAIQGRVEVGVARYPTTAVSTNALSPAFAVQPPRPRRMPQCTACRSQTGQSGTQMPAPGRPVRARIVRWVLWALRGGAVPSALDASSRTRTPESEASTESGSRTLETLAPICCSDSSRFSHAQAREEATTILRSRSKKPDKLKWHKSWLDGREGLRPTTRSSPSHRNAMAMAAWSATSPARTGDRRGGDWNETESRYPAQDHGDRAPDLEHRDDPPIPTEQPGVKVGSHTAAPATRKAKIP